MAYCGHTISLKHGKNESCLKLKVSVLSLIHKFPLLFSISANAVPISQGWDVGALKAEGLSRSGQATAGPFGGRGTSWSVCNFRSKALWADKRGATVEHRHGARRSTFERGGGGHDETGPHWQKRPSELPRFCAKDVRH